jgi:hypothetical protein
MAMTVPHPPRRNPFKAGSMLAKQFDGILAAYAQGHRDVIRDGVRCMGNGWATSFWRGYDNAQAAWVVKGTLAWACYRAGQFARAADDKRGVFIPPKTNSGVPV